MRVESPKIHKANLLFQGYRDYFLTKIELVLEIFYREQSTSGVLKYYSEGYQDFERDIERPKT